MKVGQYQIGRYHAIIKKEYEDGSSDYETSFLNEADLMDSVRSLNQCIGKLVGLAMPNPRVLMRISVIRGKENIIKELESAKQLLKEKQDS